MKIFFKSVLNPLKLRLVCFLIWPAFFTIPMAGAGVANLTLEGVVLSYDKKTVTLGHRGKKFRYPRSAVIPKGLKLKTGKVIRVALDEKAFVKRLRKQLAEEEKK